jgi:hypothetical protein
LAENPRKPFLHRPSKRQMSNHLRGCTEYVRNVAQRRSEKKALSRSEASSARTPPVMGNS